MAVNDALWVVMATLKTELSNYSTVWDDRVYAAENIPSEVERPYLVYFYASGGEVNQLPHDDAILVMTVKVVSDNAALAMQGAADISAALNNRGEVGEKLASITSAGSDWRINTITKERRIFVTETFNDARAVYHSGHQFRFFMEVIT